MPPRLRALAEDAARQPFGAPLSASASEVDAAKGLVGVVRDGLAGASGEERLAILFPLSDVVGKPDVMVSGSEAEQTRFWRAYHTALGHVPARVLDGAVKAFIAQAPAKDRNGRAYPKRFPEPGVLLELCRADEAWTAEMTLLRGLESIAAIRLRRAKERLSPDEEAFHVARAQSWLEGFRARLRAEAESAAAGLTDEAFRARLHETKSLRKAFGG